MASTEKSKLYTVVIQCDDRIFHWDEYFSDLYENAEPKGLGGGGCCGGDGDRDDEGEAVPCYNMIFLQ